MKKAFLVLSAAILASFASASEERVVATQGSLVNLTYNGAVQNFTIPAFVIKPAGVTRTLTGVTIKVYQRPVYTLGITTNLPLNETFSYQVSASTTARVLNDAATQIFPNQTVAVTSIPVSGTLVNGVFSRNLSYSGPNDLVFNSTQLATFPTRPNNNAAAKNVTVQVSGTVTTQNLFFKTGGVIPTITYNGGASSTVTGQTTVVAIYTFTP